MPRDPMYSEHQQHAQMFGGVEGGNESGSDDDRSVEERYAPVEVDLNEPEPPPPPKDGAPVPPVQSQPRRDAAAEELQRQLAQQRDATARAEMFARDAMQRAAFAERRVTQSSANMVDSAIEAAQVASREATQRLQQALDAGRSDIVAATQVEISDARHNLLRLQEQRAMLEAEAQRPQPQPQPRPQQQQPMAPPNPDAIVQGLARDGYPRSASWLRSHPDMMSRENLDKVANTHNYIVETLKFIPETDEYFAKMESELYGGGRRNGARSFSAPVSSSAPSLSNGQPKRSHVPLSGNQRHHAIDVLGMTEREYAEAFEDARTNNKLIGYR